MDLRFARCATRVAARNKPGNLVLARSRISLLVPAHASGAHGEVVRRFFTLVRSDLTTTAGPNSTP